MSRFSIPSLRAIDSPVMDARLRICTAFQWGKKEIDGQLELGSFFQLLEEHPNADIPFYVFENDIGGKQHTHQNYRM